MEEKEERLKRKEKAAWNSFVAVVWGFQCNYIAKYNVELVKTVMKNYDTGGYMSLKVHILEAHLDKFKANMGEYSEEQGQ